MAIKFNPQELIEKYKNVLSGAKDILSSAAKSGVMGPGVQSYVNRDNKNAPYLQQQAGQYLQNRYIQPVKDIPKNIQQTFGKNKTLGERGMGLLGTLGGVATFVPDPLQDVAMPLFDFYKGFSKGAIQGQTPKKQLKTGLEAMSLQNPVGIGEAITKNEAASNLLNIAELPILIAGGMVSNKLTAKKLKELDSLMVQGKSLAENYNIFEPAAKMEALGKIEEIAGKLGKEHTLKKSKYLRQLFATQPEEYFSYMKGLFEDAHMQNIHPEHGVGIRGLQVRVMQKESVPVKSVRLTKETLLPETEGTLKSKLPQNQVLSSKVSAQEPIIPVGTKYKKEIDAIKEKQILNETIAQMSTDERNKFSPKIIKEINILKRVSKNDKFASGDIETYRRELPQLTESVVGAVRENPQYSGLSDSEALQIAFNLPTKAATTPKKVDTSYASALKVETILQEKKFEKFYGKPQTETQFNRDFNDYQKYLEMEANGVTKHGKVTSAQTPKYKLEAKVKESAWKQQEKDYKEWQKALVGQEGLRTEGQAIEDLTKQMKTSTNLSILDNADNWKDKPRLSYGRETMERNFEDIMGKDAGRFKDELLEPVFKANADITKFKNTERAEIKALGIKPRSNESKLLQLYGEGQMHIDELRRVTPQADKIIKAEQVIRQKYDMYLDILNKVLVRNGYDPVPKRKDYFHHFEDLKGMFDQVGVAIKAEDLPTDINGLTADFKPGRTFFNATLQRKGIQTSIDAITGIDKYLDGLANQIYHTDNIQRLRAFESAIREKYAGTQHLTNFVADLGEYINGVAGKKAMIDRAVESLVGRRIYTGVNLLKKQTGANMVGANVSSALTNFIPITQTMATTNKISNLQALMGILKNTFKDDGFIKSSDFLTSRIGSDKLAMTNWEKIGKTGNWVFKTIDNFASQFAVRSKYLDGIKSGLSNTEAMKQANTWGRKVLAGRSMGEMPTMFNARTLGLLTQFQLEVNNQMSFMFKDIPRNFNKLGAASAMAQLFLYSYLYNNLFEQITGRRPSFDPVGLAQKTYEDYTNPNMKEGQATKNLVKNVSDQLPFTSTFTGGRIPIGSSLPNPLAIVSGDSTLIKEVQKPLYYLLPPTGGAQIKKFIEGSGAYNKGVSVTDKGSVRYPIPQTLSNKIKTSVFGQYSIPEAQTYFREGRNVLGEKQSEFLLNTQDKVGAYNKIISARQKENINKKGLQKEGAKKTGNIYQYLGDDGSVKEIDLSFPVKGYTKTGNKELDKEYLSDYKGSITSAKNNVMEALQVGAITENEAISQLERLTKLSNVTKKPKKITIKKVSFKKVSTPKIKKVSIPAPRYRKVKKYTVSIPKIKKPKITKTKLSKWEPKAPKLT